MKKLFTLLIFCLISFYVNGQEVVDAKKLGLVSYITYVKAISEFKMTSLVTSENYSLMPDKAKQFNSDYNLLKLSVDLLVNQLSADLFDSNRLKLYRKLNDHLKYGTALPKKYDHYALLLEQIDGQLEALRLRKYTGGTLSGPSLEEFTGVVSEVREIVTSARDFREKKIQSLLGLLKALTLSPLSDLIKPKEAKN